MENNQIVIPKDRQLPIAEDYFALRTEGLTAIEALGSSRWTDYNAHDPGITTLEILCYTLSELGYRTGLKIEDLLTEENGLIGFQQAFFTARRILTNNPLTENDFRRILIDLPNIENGWLLCKSCYCETALYAECKESELFFAPLWRLEPPRPNITNFKENLAQPHEHPLHPKGLYDVLLELEDDPELGDLNDRKIVHNIQVALADAGEYVPLTIELRFPQDWEADEPELFQQFISPDFELDGVIVNRFSRDRILDELPDQTSFIQGWRNIFYADIEIQLINPDTTDTASILLNQTTIRFFSPKESVKRIDNLYTDIILPELENSSQGSIAFKYKEKLSRRVAAITEAKFAINQYRNLGEDFCNVKGVGIEDIGVCMDVELSTDADVEWVMANIYNEIELYFNPPVPFYTLQELVAEGIPSEEIFEGPALENGFIKEEELEVSQLRSYLYVSDIINRIMDIEGVIAVKNVLLTRYNQLGQAISPSERWKVPVTAGFIPRLYEQTSRILFYKNNLPFLPRLEEARAVLVQLRGERDRPKIPIAENDFPVPIGIFRELADFFPIQYSFPQTYQIGPEGLPANATVLRQAQARQFKGYLMTYEQIAADMLMQLANAKALFSLDESIQDTYFQRFFDPAATNPEIMGQGDLLLPTLTAAELGELTEPREVFLDRRNRFLDHILARFGEQFRDYALLLYANSDRIPFAPDKLIQDKIRFLKDYPRDSSQRAKAFNYKDEDRVCDYRNRAGLAGRISRLLGLESLRAYFQVDIQATLSTYETNFTLVHPETGQTLLFSPTPLGTNSVLEAELGIYDLIGDVIANSIEAIQYGTDGDGNAILNNANNEIIAQLDGGITPQEVIDFCTAILAKERIYIVEHLLLRPKFPGDAVMPVCLEEDCVLCGEEDPYSFQITYVMQGKLSPFSFDIDLRQFANDTIRKETPAHLLPKICWVGNDMCTRVGDQAIICDLQDLLQSFLTVEEEEEINRTICLCANEVFNTFNEAVALWGVNNDPAELSATAIQEALQAIFEAVQPEGSLDCHEQLDPAYYVAMRDLMVSYFGNNLSCYQYNQFERAWCNWLEVNASFDWATATDLLHRRVQRLLENHQAAIQDQMDHAGICNCTELLLGYFGNQFKAWIDSLVEAEIAPEDEDLIAQLDTVVWQGFQQDRALINENGYTLCEGILNNITPEFWEELRSLLIETYQNWILVSYRLNELIRIFSTLKSIYPSATLHDCDDGSDDNPVRLNNTILGSL